MTICLVFSEPMTIEYIGAVCGVQTHVNHNLYLDTLEKSKLKLPISYWHTTNKSTCTHRSCLGSVKSGAKTTSSHGTSWKTPSWDTMKNPRCLEDSKLMGKNRSLEPGNKVL